MHARVCCVGVLIHMRTHVHIVNDVSNNNNKKLISIFSHFRLLIFALKGDLFKPWSSQSRYSIIYIFVITLFTFEPKNELITTIIGAGS